MPQKNSKIIGFRHPHWSSSGPKILGGIVDFIRSHEPWRIVTANKSYGEMEEVKIDEHWSGDGLILFRATEEELATYRRRGIAVVLTSSEGPDGGFPRAVPDNEAIGREVARHLLGCGLSSLAFLARGETFYREAQFAPGFRLYARERFRGFRDELARATIEPRIHYLRGRPLWESHTWREIQMETMAFLQTLQTPCGLFAVDDSLAAVVLRSADMLGLKVPDELAVMGYGDDHSYCYASFPALSSIAAPDRKIGRAAAELLWRQFTHQTIPPKTTIAPGVTRERESTDTRAIRDPLVSSLVRWIGRRTTEDSLRIADLCEHSGVSATTIKTRFAASLGHSPKAEIKKARLKHLTFLLENSELSINEIATRMNFASAHELSRFFNSCVGKRPSEFRRNPNFGKADPIPGGH